MTSLSKRLAGDEVSFPDADSTFFFVCGISPSELSLVPYVPLRHESTMGVADGEKGKVCPSGGIGVMREYLGK
jgi:hypothetical protein